MIAGNSSVLRGDKESADFKGSLLPTSLKEEEKPQKDHIEDDREQEPQRSDCKGQIVDELALGWVCLNVEESEDSDR